MKTFTHPVFERTGHAIPAPSVEAPQSARGLRPGGTGAGVLGLSQVSLSRVRLRRAANQSINDSAATSIAWDTNVVDTDNYDLALNAALVIPFTGSYLVISNCRWAANATNQRQLFCEKSTDGGSTFNVLPTLVDNRTGVAVVATTNSIQGMQAFNILDQIRIRVSQNSGGPLNMTDADIQLVYLGPI